MALITAEQYEESLKKRRPRIFMNGKKVEDYLNNPNIRTVIEANKASYRWALDPAFQEIMTTISPLTNDRVNRYV
ncbi:MAG: 4-hydroxyphenylacetate 3-hydroxylase N-terminal domain-containing protein, partial [Thermodesulfobacteriota bacterium]|nr:4-hydroxyphenylacetate 3-hydroxylase N-terminal domain-containing protein [Thermodesulfobacteriota bacterium]